MPTRRQAAAAPKPAAAAAPTTSSSALLDFALLAQNMTTIKRCLSEKMVHNILLFFALLAQKQRLQ